MEIIDGGLQPDSSPGPFSDPLDDLGDGRRLRDAREFGRQILLQRLACGFGAALKARVDFGGKVSNQHVRHACIMLAPRRVRKSTVPRLRAQVVGARLPRCLPRNVVSEHSSASESDTSPIHVKPVF